MPGTDGPGQFPRSQSHPCSRVPGTGRPRHLCPRPRPGPECGITAAANRGTFLPPSPHTPTHTVSESPNVPEVDTFPLLAGKNMQMIVFYTLAQKACRVAWDGGTGSGSFQSRRGWGVGSTREARIQMPGCPWAFLCPNEAFCPPA